MQDMRTMGPGFCSADVTSLTDGKKSGVKRKIFSPEKHFIHAYVINTTGAWASVSQARDIRLP
jgi:hypothetical protein